MITIVDYGLGNVRAFLNLYKRMNIDAVAATSAGVLSSADHIILPGVGAFDHAMDLLDGSGMRETLDELVLDKKVPVLGVCVGMQILADGSDEGERKGLGWVGGQVRDLRTRTNDLPLPHMGWNDVAPAAAEGIFAGLGEQARFYFLHSYFFDCDSETNAAATATYSIPFACSVRSGNIWGVQFHPEKSHHYGMRLLKNFAEL